MEQPCEDLRFAHHIGLTSTLNTVYSRELDYVKVRGWRCPIKEIRPVDYGRLQADLRREREMQQAQTAGGPGARWQGRSCAMTEARAANC